MEYTDCKETKTLKLFVLGDSISLHYGPYLMKYLDGHFIYHCKEGYEKAFKNLDFPKGANGGDSSMVCDYLREIVSTKGFNYDYLLLNCGLHDIKTNPTSKQKQVSQDTYCKNLHEIIRIITTQTNAKIIWVRSTPIVDEIHNSLQKDFFRYNNNVISYNQIADRIFAASGSPIIDLYNFTLNIDHSDNLFCDHAHFHPNIRQLQAAFIAGQLMSLYKTNGTAK